MVHSYTILGSLIFLVKALSTAYSSFFIVVLFLQLYSFQILAIQVALISKEKTVAINQSSDILSKKLISFTSIKFSYIELETNSFYFSLIKAKAVLNITGQPSTKKHQKKRQNFQFERDLLNRVRNQAGVYITGSMQWLFKASYILGSFSCRRRVKTQFCLLTKPGFLRLSSKQKQILQIGLYLWIILAIMQKTTSSSKIQSSRIDRKFIPWQQPICGNQIDSAFSTLKSESFSTY